MLRHQLDAVRDEVGDVEVAHREQQRRRGDHLVVRHRPLVLESEEGVQEPVTGPAPLVGDQVLDVADEPVERCSGARRLRLGRGEAEALADVVGRLPHLGPVGVGNSEQVADGGEGDGEGQVVDRVEARPIRNDPVEPGVDLGPGDVGPGPHRLGVNHRLWVRRTRVCFGASAPSMLSCSGPAGP